MCCLHLLSCLLFPHCSVLSIWVCEPCPTKRKNANKSVPKIFLVFLGRQAFERIFRTTLNIETTSRGLQESKIWIDLFANDPRHVPRFKIQSRLRTTRPFKSHIALYPNQVQPPRVFPQPLAVYYFGVMCDTLLKDTKKR